METNPAPGAFAVREDSSSDVDRAVGIAAGCASAFARLPLEKKGELLERVAESLSATAADTVALGCEAKGIDRGSRAEAAEWFAGPCVSVGLARHHAAALRDIAKQGRPRPPRAVASSAPRSGRIVTDLPPIFPGGGSSSRDSRSACSTCPARRKPDVLRGQEALTAWGRAGTTAVPRRGQRRERPVADVIHALFVETARRCSS